MTFKSTALAVAISAALCGSAWAVDPQSVRIGDGILFTPTLKVSERYEDNFRALERNEESSWITSIAPSLTLTAEGSKTGYKLNYTTVSDIFHSSRSDDNTDHHLTGEMVAEFNSRNRIKLDAAYHKVEETAAADQNIENDRYSSALVGGLYTFGARSARTQVDLGASYEELRYQNSGNLNADKERDTVALRSTVYYAVTPRTRVLGELRHTDYDYVSYNQRDSKNLALLTGATWDATARTSGTVKIGAERKRFDQSGIDNKSGSMWEAGLSWAPRTYSTFNLHTRRSFDEGEDNASTIRAMSAQLSWEHQWLERLSSTVSLGYVDKEYQDYARDDELTTLGFGLTYAMRRWLDVGIGYKYAENDSTQFNESYTRNIYMLSVTASL
ncbi:outer membrane beta-barrel protein [Stutzerimonas tarimensis]|uniref:Outer membrane beta-barrel protein n=1 Tax=Stutzerimonas tarimensis TaxID=1507735 RepID=A0ABV7T6R3_9GAMM